MKLSRYKDRSLGDPIRELGESSDKMFPREEVEEKVAFSESWLHIIPIILKNPKYK
jgi:hypothetical protein